MAATFERIKVSYSLASVVDSAITSIRATRSVEQAKSEAAFQQAVADGLSYDGQVQFRKQQIDDLKTSSFTDPEYETKLTESLSELKRLARFGKYRAKYQMSLTDLMSGKITAEQHLSMLQDSLSQTTDVDLQNEINKEITDASAKVKEYHDTILINQVKRAQNDGSSSILSDAISKVQDKRSLAQLSGNDEEVSAYDNTLTVLKSQLGKVKIEDEMNSAQVKNITKGLGVADKLNTLNTQIATADSTAPVTINGTRYASSKDFWMQLRDGYVAGNGTGLFKDVSSELESYYKESVDASVARDGYATAMTLDSIKTNFDLIKNRPEMQPYLEKFNNIQGIVMSYAFDTTAKKIVNNASFSGDFKGANEQLINFSKKYGVDSESYRLQIANELTQQALSQNVVPAPLLKESGLTPETFKTPTAEPTATAIVPPTPITPAPTPTMPTPTTPTVSTTVPAAEQTPAIPKIGDTIPGTNLKYEAADIANLKSGITPTAQKPAETPAPTPTPAATPTATPTQTAPITPKIGDVIPGTNLRYEAADIANLGAGGAAPTQITPTAEHSVVAGDTIRAIADKNNTTVSKILELNPQYKENPNLIKPGEKIKLA